MLAWSAPTVPHVPGNAPILEVHDTATGRLRDTADAGKANAAASMYVCGITPYDATHMGHAATYVAFDLLQRTWRDAGRKVTYVQNVTDIDDPLLERAAATGIDWQVLAKEQTDLFRADMEALNVIPPEHYIGAVESISWLVPVVEELVAKDLAYRGARRERRAGRGHLLLTPSAAASDAWELGTVSGYDRETMLGFFAERGGDPERPGKRDALDPLLWRVARAGEPEWDGASLGAGPPGLAHRVFGHRPALPARRPSPCRAADRT